MKKYALLLGLLLAACSQPTAPTSSTTPTVLFPLTPTRTASPSPTQTASPTPTMLPPTPAPSPTATLDPFALPDHAYTIQSLAISNRYAFQAQKLDDLLERAIADPAILDDEGWQAEAQSVAEALRTLGETVRSMIPPANLALGHSLLLAVADRFDEIAATLDELLASGDPTFLDEISSKLAKGRGLAGAAAESAGARLTDTKLVK